MERYEIEVPWDQLKSLADTSYDKKDAFDKVRIAIEIESGAITITNKFGGGLCQDVRGSIVG